jgi:hypothetical protein
MAEIWKYVLGLGNGTRKPEKSNLSLSTNIFTRKEGKELEYQRLIAERQPEERPRKLLQKNVSPMAYQRDSFTFTKLPLHFSIWNRANIKNLRFVSRKVDSELILLLVF